MFSADKADDKELRLIVRFCPDFQQIGVIPQRLGHHMANLPEAGDFRECLGVTPNSQIVTPQLAQTP
jgi:hypothetical protein